MCCAEKLWKSLKLISNSESCDFVYFLTRAFERELELHSFLHCHHHISTKIAMVDVSNDGSSIAISLMPLAHITAQQPAPPCLSTTDEYEHMVWRFFFIIDYTLKLPKYFKNVFRSSLLPYGPDSCVNGQGQRWDPRQCTGMATRPSHFKCGKFFFSLYFHSLTSSLKGTTRTFKFTPLHKHFNTCPRPLRQMRQAILEARDLYVSWAVKVCFFFSLFHFTHDNYV